MRGKKEQKKNTWVKPNLAVLKIRKTRKIAINKAIKNGAKSGAL
jgi:hypothetical protein